MGEMINLLNCWGCFLQRPGDSDSIFMFRSAPRTSTKHIPSFQKFPRTFYITQLIYIYILYIYIDTYTYQNLEFETISSEQFSLWILHPQLQKNLQGASDQTVVKLLQEAALRTNSSSLALLSRRIRSVLRLGSPRGGSGRFLVFLEVVAYLLKTCRRGLWTKHGNEGLYSLLSWV